MVNSSHEIRRHLLLGRNAVTNLDPILRSRDTTLLTKVHMVFQCYVWMWELNHKENWTQKNWFWNVVLEKTSENLLDSKEVNLVNPKGNQPWIFIGRTTAEAPKFWPPDVKSIRKNLDAGNDQSQKERGWQKMTWVDNTPDSMTMSLSKLEELVEDRGAWGCCSWGHNELDTT